MDYAGAIYRVISRGNYRKNLFTVEEGSVAFERAFLKMVERCGWELLAYMIMRHHSHLAVNTPESNLVAGVKWP